MRITSCLILLTRISITREDLVNSAVTLRFETIDFEGVIMSDVTQNGAAGSAGTNGVGAGSPGTTGGPGVDATATNPGNGIDITNTANATGGTGGQGGNGG